MQTGFRSQSISNYRSLTEDQIKHIHRASLTILETVGIRVENEAGRRLLMAAGCRSNDENNVLIPGDLVEQCIRSAPAGLPPEIHSQVAGIVEEAQKALPDKYFST